MAILATRDVEKAKATLDAIVADMELKLSVEKTRIVRAEDGFDFLGFHFLRRYDPRRGKRKTRWYPSTKSEKSVRARVRELTETRTMVRGTPFTAREAVEEVLRGWAGYARRSMAFEAFQRVWWYSTGRLNRLYRRSRNRPGRARHREVVRLGLTLAHWPTPIPYERRNAA
ncbi:RNA-directed DNA polymerase [mine drainage metagenome]|uniref:RNA-directed DNA polymerase n=1 Tax=mine drainage metagenome TaxID=410659 RepID=T1D8D0_9ZZZZ